MYTFGDIDPMEGAFDSQFTDMTSLAALPALTQAAAATGQEAPAMAAQRPKSRPPKKTESLRDIYRTGRETAAAENPEGDRKPFSWDDLDKGQRKDVLLRLGLSLMQHAPTGIGLSGFGKAGADVLGFMDELQEKNRTDAKDRRKESTDEGMRLAQLAGMEANNAARDRQLDQGDRQVLPSADGFYLADLADGTAEALTTGDGETFAPASTGRDSVYQQMLDIGAEIAKERGLTGVQAKQFAADYAGKNRTHVDPSTYIRARAQVMDMLMPNGRPSRQMRDLMEQTGQSEQEIIAAQTDEVISGYQQNYGYGLSEMGGAGAEGGETNPFLIQE